MVEPHLAVNMAQIRVASVILYREGRVLLQHRDDDPNIASPGMWACFGGHLDNGEDAEQGARREIEEEIGYRICDSLELLEVQVSGARETHFFLARLTIPPDQLDLREGQAMRLVAPEEFDSIPIVAAHRGILDRFAATHHLA